MSKKKDVAQMMSTVGLVIALTAILGVTALALSYGNAGIFSTEQKTNVFVGAIVLLAVGVALFVGGLVRTRTRR